MGLKTRAKRAKPYRAVGWPSPGRFSVLRSLSARLKPSRSGPPVEPVYSSNRTDRTARDQRPQPTGRT
ncbi:MAG: hypothetical protein H6631_05695 [Anaerolineaceae bacterium]|nr:hypothetical protein [Anaerolineaceae bacterium]MCB9102186.1 hypothetical protein [Anaerolineales bacterium]